MKKYIVLFILISTFVCLEAKSLRRSTLPLLEIGPKASLYISNDIALGIGAELVCNPVRNIGIRLDVTELRFGGNTIFYLNCNSSLDGLFYIPMRGFEPYVHGGVGFMFVDNEGSAGSSTSFTMRFGMGGLFPINNRTNFFVEPGIVVEDLGDNTNAIFRLSFGARFGVL
ncbi:MAG TPA: hypothetical protein VF399_08025 [bacterium]